MALLPHIIVLNELRNGFAFLKGNPEHIMFSLGGYCVNKDLASIYGARFVDQAIQWVLESDIAFTLGYRLNTDKVPSIAVMYEGGDEKEQFLGDYGRNERVCISPTVYVRDLNLKDLDGYGNAVVSKELNIREKVWRRLVLRKGTVHRSIVGFEQTLGAKDDVLVLDKPITLEDGFGGWEVVSSVDQKNRIIGSSLDLVRVKIYVDVSGDPELGEMVSCLVRYLLKQARMRLMAWGLNTPTLSHSSIMRNDNYGGTNVWSSEFVITGKLTDEWILIEHRNPDKLLLSVTGVEVNNEQGSVTIQGIV
jgi:hypothetical protein